jgi:hypothetical protein
MEDAIPPLPPAILMSVLVGALWTCVYVLIRGRLRLHVLLVLPAGIAGAWAGQALGERLGDPARLGDYGMLWASVFAWIGIVVVSVAATVGARTPKPDAAPGTAAAPGSSPTAPHQEEPR